MVQNSFVTFERDYLLHRIQFLRTVYYETDSLSHYIKDDLQRSQTLLERMNNCSAGLHIMDTYYECLILPGAPGMTVWSYQNGAGTPESEILSLFVLNIH